MATKTKGTSITRGTIRKAKGNKEAAKAQPEAQGLCVILTKERDCKHSVRYITAEIGKVVDNVYVGRLAMKNEMPQQVRLTVFTPEQLPQGLQGAVVLAAAKDCKHSVRYSLPSEDPAALLSSLYVNRLAFNNNMPKVIAVTVEPA